MTVRGIIKVNNAGPQFLGLICSHLSAILAHTITVTVALFIAFANSMVVVNARPGFRKSGTLTS